MCKYVQDLLPHQSSHALPCSRKLLVIALIHMTAMLLIYSLHKYYITKNTYFFKAYNHASFEDLEVRGTSLTSLHFHHVVTTDCGKLNSMALCSNSQENQPADSQTEMGMNAHVRTRMRARAHTHTHSTTILKAYFFWGRG